MICDVDARAVEVARSLHGAAILRADVVEDGLHLPYDDASFDLVCSTEVIEHVGEPAPWLRELARVTRPGGGLFLTTPNCASWPFRVLEATVLELVARASGFSRRRGGRCDRG